jgi:hypothetical protein
LVNASRRETFPARNSRANVAPKEIQFFWTALRDEELRTSIVDKSVDVPWIGLDLLESLLDRLVATNIYLNRLDSILKIWTFVMKVFDGQNWPCPMNGCP